MNRIIKYFTGILIIATPLSGQDTITDPWSLEQCIGYALENNLQVKKREINSLVMERDFQQSRINILPDMNAAVEHNLSSGRSLDMEQYEWVTQDLSQGNFGIQSNMTLFNGLQGYNNIKMRQYNLLRSQAELEVMKNEITFLVTTGYLQLLLDIELLNIAREKTEVTRKAVERMEKLVEVGNEARGSLLEVKAQLSTENYNMTVAENRVKTSILNLIQILDMEYSPEFTIVVPELSEYDIYTRLIPIDSIFANALQLMPEIEAAMLDVRSSEKLLAIERGKRVPEVYLRGLYYSRYISNVLNPGNESNFSNWLWQIEGNQYKQVSLGVNIPIFNRWVTETSIRKAKLDLADAEIEMQRTRNELLKKIQQFYTDAVNARDRYISAEEALQNNEEAFRYTEQRFAVGLATALELDEARNNLYEARSSLIQARYQFIFYTKILNFYQGQEISL